SSSTNWKIRSPSNCSRCSTITRIRPRQMATPALSSMAPRPKMTFVSGSMWPENGGGGPWGQSPPGSMSRGDVRKKSRSAPAPPPAHDAVVADRDGTDRLRRMRMSAEQLRVHGHQARREPQRGHILADAAHDGMLAFEATRNADQFLQQTDPVLPACFDH